MPLRTIFGRYRPLLTLLVVAVFGLHTGTSAAQIQHLVPADSVAGDYFGGSVAIDGGRLIVGASGRDACGPDSGIAMIYELDADQRWQMGATLTASDCAEGAYFGRAVDISGDYAVVTSYHPFFSAYRSNAVYVFERAFDGEWNQAARLTAWLSDTEGPFASSVAIDGNRIVVTTAGETASGRQHGVAYVFERGPDRAWKQTARIETTRSTLYGVFGTAAALHGDRFVVAASTYTRKRPGSLYVYDRQTDGSWSETAFLTGIDDFFIPIDLDGDRLLVGESRGGIDHAGQASIFERSDAGTWQRSALLSASAPYPSGGFGSAVALDGDRALVVGFDEQLKLSFNIDRVVYQFARDPQTGSWSQRHIIDVGALFFGTAIDLNGGRAVIGEASDGITGSVYVAQIR